MSRRGRARRQPVAKAPTRQLAPRAITPDDVVAILTAAMRGGQGTALARDPSWNQLPFGPGEPLIPAFINPPRRPGQQPGPRLGEYPVSYNLQVSQQSHVNWKTLQDAADMPLFRKCIERRKGICDNDYAVVVDPAAVTREAMLSGSAKTDVEAKLREKYTAQISAATDFLAMPDRKNGLDWTAWAKVLMENTLKYDATVVYPRRTVGGQLYSLEVPDGHLFKPLIDESGGRPLPPLPAVQQILYGFPRGEYTADVDAEGGVPGGMSANEILYRRRIIRGFGSPYGMPPVEIALLDGLVWMRRMGWIMAEYTEGATPASFLETDNAIGWDVPQWEVWTNALNDLFGGNTAQRFKIKPLPPGSHLVQTADIPERYKPDYDMFLIKLVAGDFGLTATELGFPEVGSLGASFHEGEEDVMNRVTRRPDANWIEGIATELLQRHLGMPNVLKVQILGLEAEDEAAADQVAQNQVQTGRMTLNQDNARRGVPAYDFPEADMPMLMTARGVVFLEGASKQATPGELVSPGQAPPAAVPGQVPGPGGEGAGPPAGAGQQQQGKPSSADQGKQQDAAKALAALGQVAYEAAALARGDVASAHEAPEAVAVRGEPRGDPDPGQRRTRSGSLDGAGREALRHLEPRAGNAADSRAEDVAAYRRWLRNGARRGEFACKALARADAPPEMAADDRVVFKEDPGPKVPARRGLAGTGTRS